jgi:hypothetical protein
LDFRCGHGPVDEVADEGGTTLVIQLACGDTFERSTRDRRCFEQGVEHLGEGGIVPRPFFDLASQRGNGCRHVYILRSRGCDRNNRNTGCGLAPSLRLCRQSARSRLHNFSFDAGPVT